ncbi:MAG TPA: MFS transporter, partial [Solirubrobacteraceae bacterium]|nr:MFS transporter [Solirubrobacteraceae bacterium]
MRKKFALIELMKHREPALLVSGQSVSNFGDGVALVALTLLVLETTHYSVTRLSWFAAARMIPLVAFLLVGGAIVDRFSRRVLLLISDGGRAVLTGGLVALIATGALRYWELIVFAVLFGCFDAVFIPAMSAMTPEIVTEELLPAMNAVRPLANNLMGSMIGPAVGGLIAAFSTSWAMAIDGATFLVSFAALALMKPTPRPARSGDNTMIEDIKEGLSYVRRTRWLWTTLVAVAVVNAFLLTPMFVLLPYYLLHVLHYAKYYVGFLSAAGGAAGAVAALVVANLRQPKRRIRTAWGYWIVATLSALIVGVATNFWELMLVPIVAAPGIIMGNVVWESMMQSEVPRELLGRAMSVDWFVSLGISPIGLVVAGEIANYVGVQTYFVALSLISVLPGLYILTSRRINA